MSDWVSEIQYRVKFKTLLGGQIACLLSDIFFVEAGGEGGTSRVILSKAGSDYFFEVDKATALDLQKVWIKE